MTDVTDVTVSGEALVALTRKVRDWTGWGNARLELGTPHVSPFAECDHNTRTIVANPDTLVLNPHRVLLTVTPFRLRQEAVLTGALLHEAAHARHSHWRPRNASDRAAWTHADGTPVSKQVESLASLMEEARIEGIMAFEADAVGAVGLAWTMRAAAAHLVPMTQVSDDPDQQVMDVLKSWALRAGRQLAIAAHSPYTLPSWVHHFTSLLHNVIEAHLTNVLDADDTGISVRATTQHVMSVLASMATAGIDADTGTIQIDRARDVLDTLFPETEAPDVGGGCAVPGEAGEEGDGDAPSDDESDDQDSGEGEDPGEDDEPGDEGSGGEDEGDEADEADEADESEGQGGASPSPMQEAVTTLETLANSQQAQDNAAQAAAPLDVSGDPSTGASMSGGSAGAGSQWRYPTAAERDVQRNAERFLRSLIDPSEASKMLLTESPSATVDGAELAAWRAGGQVRDPKFFRRTKRTTEPSPPVKIAILVDVSASMDELQKPSALLSWALASAAVDLRNFAGRGVQVESTLIHWGSRTPRVIQANGKMMPGIREFPCDEGTSAMHLAHDMIEEQIPGFFDASATPENRLLVHFTDWSLATLCTREVIPQFQRMFEAGVRMLTVVPRNYSARSSDLPDILALCSAPAGAHAMLKYNPMFPEQVWDTAADVLNGDGGMF